MIQFPSARATADVAVAVGSGALPQVEPAAGEGKPVTEVALQLRRLVHAGAPLSAAEERSLMDLCVLSALSALAREGGEARLAGTIEHPLIEATFLDLEPVAARAALCADEQVRGAGGGEFVISGGVASGRTLGSRDGINTLAGAPAELAHELCDKAAPGQILLGGPTWETCRAIEALPTNNMEIASGSSPVFILRGAR